VDESYLAYKHSVYESQSQIADGLVGHAAESFVDKVRAHTRVYQGAVLTPYLGRQHLGAIFNLVAYYVLALPVGITLAFHPRTHLGLQGLWIGMSYRYPASEFALTLSIGRYQVKSWACSCWDRRIRCGVARD